MDDGIVSGRTLNFSDNCQSFTLNNNTGLNTAYNNGSNVNASICCGSTGLLISFNTKYVQIGASGVSLQGNIYSYTSSTSTIL